VAFELARKYPQLPADQDNENAECSLMCRFWTLESRCEQTDNYAYLAAVSCLSRSEVGYRVWKKNIVCRNEMDLLKSIFEPWKTRPHFGLS
jgi:hypothetical protein